MRTTVKIRDGNTERSLTNFIPSPSLTYDSFARALDFRCPHSLIVQSRIVQRLRMLGCTYSEWEGGVVTIERSLVMSG